VRRLVLILATLPTVACAHVPQRASAPPTPAPPAARVADASRDGKVGYRFLFEPATRVEATEGDRTEFHNPAPLDKLALPAYPADALASGATGTVVVRIVIDDEGRVIAVGDSPKEASSAGPFAAALRDAVDRTVRGWPFSPGRVEVVEDGKDLDGDGKPDYSRIVKQEYVKVFYDVRFDFTIENGKGAVRSTAP
jgi:TonB family protein